MSKWKKSGRSIQTSLFVGSLMKEMNKLADSKDRLVHLAEEYSRQGCSKDEVEELLSIDGFDKDVVESYLAAEATDDRGTLWGFKVLGSCGEHITHRDFGIEIRASSKEEATLKLKAIMDDEKDAGLEKIVDVYEL